MASGATAIFYATEDDVAAGKRNGPVSHEQLAQLMQENDIDGFTLIWMNGLSTWTPLAELDELRAKLRAVAEPTAATAAQSVDVQTPVASDATVAVTVPVTATSGHESAWFVASDAGERSGPHTLAALTAMAQSGQVHTGSLAWSAGMPSWVRIDGIPALAAVLTADGSSRADDSSSDAGLQAAAAEATLAALEQHMLSGSASAAAAASEPQANGRPQAGRKRRREGDGKGNDAVHEGGDGAAQAGRKGKGKGAKKGRNAEPIPPWLHVTGVPPDATEAELAAYFKKAGILQLDYYTGQPVVRIQPAASAASAAASELSSREAFVRYLRPEAIELAVQLLDGAHFRVGVPLEVAPAAPALARSMEAASKPPALDPHKRLTAEEAAAKVRAIEQAAALSWAEEGDESLGLRVLVIKHAFTKEDVPDADATSELQSDLTAELSKLGRISRLTLFPPADDAPADAEGVVVLRYASAGSAAECLSTFNGRWFGGRQLAVEYWDGVTSYAKKRIVRDGDGSDGEDAAADAAVTSDEEDTRLDAFGAWLEADNEEA